HLEMFSSSGAAPTQAIINPSPLLFPLPATNADAQQSTPPSEVSAEVRSRRPCPSTASSPTASPGYPDPNLTPEEYLLIMAAQKISLPCEDVANFRRIKFIHYGIFVIAQNTINLVDFKRLPINEVFAITTNMLEVQMLVIEPFQELIDGHQRQTFWQSAENCSSSITICSSTNRQ
ncbi:hypothetical protein HDU97_006442, partial [Phlyctochytrium planicorne]